MTTFWVKSQRLSLNFLLSVKCPGSWNWCNWGREWGLVSANLEYCLRKMGKMKIWYNLYLVKYMAKFLYSQMSRIYYISKSPKVGESWEHIGSCREVCCFTMLMWLAIGLDMELMFFVTGLTWHRCRSLSLWTQSSLPGLSLDSYTCWTTSEVRVSFLVIRAMFH